MEPTVATKILVLSDTHGDSIDLPTAQVDVVIHCGDLTEESKLHEMRKTLKMLRDINAPLKLVIPGNHDFTLDIPMFEKKLAEAGLNPTDEAVIREDGVLGAARELFQSDDSHGLILLDEGTHRFALKNGAQLTVYASPYTPSSTSDWGLQYDPQEDHF